MREIKITQNNVTDQWECFVDGELIARANDINVVSKKLCKYLKGQTK